MRARRGYVQAGRRLIHFTYAGSGPALVMLHASPADSAGLLPLLRELAVSFTAIAIDTPAHGGSDPLPAAEPAIADYGAALIEGLGALGLDRVHLYGTHTGAKIALSVAAAQPKRVASLFLDGLGVSTDSERAGQLLRYTPVYRPRSDGSHLVNTWHQVRNMFTFWPWYDERAAALYVGPAPAAVDVHEIALGLLTAGSSYPLAYRAAFRCDPVPMLRALTVPATVLTSRDDPLHAHLGRLGSLPPSVAIASLGHGADPVASKARLITGFALPRSGATAQRWQPAADASLAARRHYIDTEAGQVHITRSGDGPAAAIMLPPAPASACALDAVPSRGSVLAVDLPGTGRSRLDPGATVTIDSVADAVLAVADQHALPDVSLYGYGAGAGIARWVAQREPGRVRELFLGGQGTPVRASQVPDLTPAADGGHLTTAWHFLREAALGYLAKSGRWPGAYGDRADLGLLHGRLLDLATAWATFAPAHEAYAAAAEPGALAGSLAARTHQVPGVWDPFTAARLP